MSINAIDTKLNNIVVVGQGAIGLLWYHHLSKATFNQSKDVSLLASNQQQLSNHQLVTTQYQFTPYLDEKPNLYSLSYAKTVAIQHADLIILCVKSYQIVSALKQIVKDIPTQCMVLLAHNGMGTFEGAAQILPKEQRILAMLTTHGCLRYGALSIEHTGLGHSDIGLLSGELNTSEKQQLINLLNKALPEVAFHENILEKQWLKLAINCVINPITAINNIDNGEVNNQEYKALVNQLLTEVIVISQQEGINLNLLDLQGLIEKVAQATAKNCSSMRCDVLAGKPTEVDYINGYIHRLGKQYKIATPENTRLWQQVLNLKDK
jgi:2-dehydropantoate 2-reductase